MSFRDYLPSVKLISIVLSLALSVGLVYAADALTQGHTAAVSVGVVPGTPTAFDTNWEAALNAVQAQTASSTFPTPDPNFVNTLLQAAQSPNVTETVGKTLLINLSNAKSQGLGDDIPTQDQIVAAAATQLKNQQASVVAYTSADLTIIPASNSSLHDYGNAFMQALNAYPAASERATLLSIDYAVEGGDKTQAATLASIGVAYKAAATALLAVPVPQTLAPLHLEVVNNLLSISATYADMETISSDPLRGLAGLQTYENLMDEGARVFTNIAQSLSKGGILFTKDEPGSAWNVFVSP
jgi:hypothetical protein